MKSTVSIVRNGGRKWSVLLLSAVICTYTSPASAIERVYKIVDNINQTWIQIGGSITASGFTGNVQAQSGNSLRTTYSGTIKADRTGSTISFTGGSVIDAKPLTGTWQPGNVTADYAGRATIFIVSATFAGQDFIGDLISSIGMNVNGAGQFNLAAGNSQFKFTSGNVAYSSSLATGDESIVGSTVLLSGATPGLLSTSGLIETLTLPVSANLVIPLVSNGSPIGTANLTLTGQIVATALVPEPSTVALGIMAAGLGGFGWYRKRLRFRS